VKRERQLRRKCVVEASAAVMRLEHQIIELTNVVYNTNCTLERSRQQAPQSGVSVTSRSAALSDSWVMSKARRPSDASSTRYFDDVTSVASDVR
jgi:hypothetical protein